MNSIALEVKGLSKQYQLGRQVKSYRTLRDGLSSFFASPGEEFLRQLHPGRALDASLFS